MELQKCFEIWGSLLHPWSFKSDVKYVAWMASACSFAKLRESVLAKSVAIQGARVAHLSTYFDRGKKARDKEPVDLAKRWDNHQSAFDQEQRADFEALEVQVCELGITAGSVSASSSSAQSECR